VEGATRARHSAGTGRSQLIRGVGRTFGRVRRLMCLELIAVPAAPERVSAKRLSTVSGLSVRKTDRPVKGALRFSLEPGCSCSLLAESADWSQATWDLAPAVLEGLAKVVELVAEEAGGLRFQALWVGDEAETEAHVAVKQLARDIRGNKVRNKHVYWIGSRAAGTEARR